MNGRAPPLRVAVEGGAEVAVPLRGGTSARELLEDVQRALGARHAVVALRSSSPEDVFVPASVLLAHPRLLLDAFGVFRPVFAPAAATPAPPPPPPAPASTRAKMRASLEPVLGPDAARREEERVFASSAGAAEYAHKWGEAVSRAAAATSAPPPPPPAGPGAGEGATFGFVDIDAEGIRRMAFLRSVSGLSRMPLRAVLRHFRPYAERSPDSRLGLAAFTDAFMALPGCRAADSGARARATELVSRLFRWVDADQDSRVDGEELASAAAVLCGGSKASKLEAVFERFDDNRDGLLSPGEMRRYLVTMFRGLVALGAPADGAATLAAAGEVAVDEELRRCYQQCDANGDGLLSFEEFQDYHARRRPGSLAWLGMLDGRSMFGDGEDEEDEDADGTTFGGEYDDDDDDDNDGPDYDSSSSASYAAAPASATEPLFAFELPGSGGATVRFEASRVAFLHQLRRDCGLDRMHAREVFEHFGGAAARFGREAFAARARALGKRAGRERGSRIAARADDLFRFLDMNEDGTVDAGELAAGLVLLCAGGAESKLRLLFDLADEDGSGSLSRGELERFVAHVYRGVAAQAADPERARGGEGAVARQAASDFFDALDSAGDNRVSFAEWCAWHAGRPRALTWLSLVRLLDVGASPDGGAARPLGSGADAAAYDDDNDDENDESSWPRPRPAWSVPRRAAAPSTPSPRRQPAAAARRRDGAKSTGAMRRRGVSRLRTPEGGRGSGARALLFSPSGAQARSGRALPPRRGPDLTSSSFFADDGDGLGLALPSAPPRSPPRSPSPRSPPRRSPRRSPAPSAPPADEAVCFLSSFRGGERQLEMTRADVDEVTRTRHDTGLGDTGLGRVVAALHALSAQGLVDSAGFCRALQRLHADDPSPAVRGRRRVRVAYVADRLFRQFDRDRAGLVPAAELAASLAVYAAGTLREKLEAAFSATDGSRRASRIPRAAAERLFRALFRGAAGASIAFRAAMPAEAERLERRAAAEAVDDLLPGGERHLTLARLERWAEHDGSGRRVASWLNLLDDTFALTR